MKIANSSFVAGCAALLSLLGCSTGPITLDPFGRPYDKANMLQPTTLTNCTPVEVDEPPKLVSGTRPLFPVGEMMKGRAGSVKVYFEVTPEGKAQIVSHEGENRWFATHAALAMKDWVLQPARKSGQSLVTTCSMEFVYRY